jgi:predicted Zn-dependent protease
MAALKREYRAARQLVEKQIPALTREPPGANLLVRLGDVALENGDSVAAEDFYALSLRGDRDFRLGYLKLVSTAGERGQLPTAIAVVENWVVNHPADTLSKRLLAQMKETQRFPDELRWENLAKYFPVETLPAPGERTAPPSQ